MGRKRKSKKIKSIFEIVIATILLILGSIFYREQSSEKAFVEYDGDYFLEVHYIDVGQGDSSLIINNADDISILIDGGETDYGDDVLGFLKSQNIEELDYVVATHPHSDHIGGLVQVLNNLPVKNVIMPDIEHTSKTYENLINGILNNEANTEVIIAQNGMNLEFGNLKAEIYAPFGNTDDLNNNSVVMKMDYAGNSFLFTGDMEKVVEEEILDYGYNIDVDFLKVAHHGSDTSSSDEFISEVSPEISIIQVGAGNSYGHPTEQTLEVLKKYETEIYRTDLNGDISILFDNDGYTIKTEK